jgi:hypothetical protein
MLNNKGAQRQAAERARRSLEKRLRRGVDPVACPDCGWYQAQMVRELRRRVLRPLIWVGIVPPILALVVIAMALLTAGGVSRIDGSGWRIIAGVVGVAAAAAGASLGTRYWVQCQLNPNHDHPMRPQSYPGAPAPWKLDASGFAVSPRIPPTPALDQSNDSVLQYERPRPEAHPGGWIVVQLARVRFPEVCCRCLAGTRNVYQFPYHDRVNTPLRLCEVCTRRERRRMYACFGLGFLPVWIIIAIGVLSSKRMTPIEVAKALLLVGPIVAGLFGIVTGAMGSRMLSYAVELRRFSQERNTIEIRFRNRGYLDLFLEAQRDTGVHAVSSSSPTARLSA